MSTLDTVQAGDPRPAPVALRPSTRTVAPGTFAATPESGQPPARNEIPLAPGPAVDLGGRAGTARQQRLRPILRRSTLITAGAAVAALDVHLISPYVGAASAAVRRPVLSWLVIALALEIVSLVAAAVLQRRMLLATGTRVPLPTAVSLTYAATAMSVSLPAGPAVSAGYTFRRLRQLGASTATASFTLISSGVVSTLAYALLAVAGLTIAGGSAGGPAAVGVGLIAGGVLVLVTRSLLSRPEFVERAGTYALRGLNRLLRREPDAGTIEWQRSTRVLASIRPRNRDWAVALTASVVNWLGDLACLYAAAQAVGADGATIGVVLLAYLAGTSVSGISFVPGGLGVVDAAVIFVLVHNGVGTAPAAAAVLLYRILSFGFNVLVGWSAWVLHAHPLIVRHDNTYQEAS